MTDAPKNPTPEDEDEKDGDKASPSRPEDEPKAVLELREKIEATLAKIYEDYEAQESGMYVVGFDTARVFIVPTWLDEETTVIRLFAITNMDVPVTQELTSYLLAKNLEFVFGAFALDIDRGAVWFTHNLLGEFTAPEEMEATLAAVSETAAEYDNEIKAKFGGRLYTEAPEESVPSPAVPGYL